MTETRLPRRDASLKGGDAKMSPMLRRIVAVLLVIGMLIPAPTAFATNCSPFRVWAT